MISWMAARMDGDNYGELILFNFPKDRTIWGPQQIEARIDQNSVISQQISLWDQRGSSVIRGNLLVLPVNDSILYVEPLYLRSDKSQLPELARVIVAYGDMVVMEENLDAALMRIFGDYKGDGVPVPPADEEPEPPADDEEPPADDEEPVVTPPPGLDPELRLILQQAAELFSRAQERLREGDFAQYGRIMEELEELLAPYQ